MPCHHSSWFRVKVMFIPQCVYWFRLPLVILVCGMAKVIASEEVQESSAKDLLMTMTHAMRTLNYDGTLVYLRNGKMETMRIFHAVKDGIEQERLVALNSPMREVIRDKDKVICYFPDSQKAYVEQRPTANSFLINLPKDLEDHENYYSFNLLEKEVVAQKMTQQISITPKDQYRYERKIWLDLDINLPLKFQLLDTNHQVIEQVIFTGLEIKESIPLRFLNATTNVEKFSWHFVTREKVPVKSPDWFFEPIPNGFKQVLFNRYRLPNSQQLVDHILLSDGFSSVSVYIDKLDNNEVEPRKKALGAINTYRLNKNNHKITVMGEVPRKTVRAIGDGIHIRDAE